MTNLDATPRAPWPFTRDRRPSIFDTKEARQHAKYKATMLAKPMPELKPVKRQPKPVNRPPKRGTSKMGRPSIAIDVQAARDLLAQGFSQREAAHTLGCSKETLVARLREADVLQSRPAGSHLSLPGSLGPLREGV